MRHDHALRCSRLPIALLIAMSATAWRAHAGTGGWTSGGPYGGQFQALATSPAAPGTLYAAATHSGGGVFKSTDFGTSWASVNTGLPTLDVTALAADPATATTVYAGTSRHGLFKSTDGGASWAAANAGLPGGAAPPGEPSLRIPAPDPTVTVIAIAPGTPEKIYVGVDSTFSDGVWRSTDSGATWLPVWANLPPRALIVDPSNPAVLYAGLDPAGLFKSTDSGTSWSNNGYTGSVPALAIDASNPSVVYAQIGPGSVPAGLYKSTNAGASFEPSGTGLPSTAYSLAVDPTTPATLYAGTDAGMFKSTNGAANWALASPGFTAPVGNSIIASSTPATLYAGVRGDGGLYRSTDAGATWSQVNQGLTGMNAYSLATASGTPGALYSGTRSGIFKSTDSGSHWAPAGLWGLTVAAVTVDPGTPATLYASTTLGILKSTDAGGSWAGPSPGSASTLSLAVDPTNPAVLLAGWEDGNIGKSTDSGATWSNLTCSCSQVNAIAFDPATPSTIFAGATTGGVLRTTNSGVTWFQMSAGLAQPVVFSLAIDPLTPATLYAGTSVGVFKSTNSGGSWAHARTGMPYHPVRALLVDPASPNTLYAGLYGGGFPYGAYAGGGVFRSTDGGGHWDKLSLGLPAPLNVRALARDAAGTLFAALEARSVWQVSALPAAFAKGDLNLDGLPDLVLRRSNGLENQAWLMNGVNRLSAAAIVPDAPTADWKVRGVDDFTDDGRNDLVFWNQVTGAVEFWIMNGAQRVAAPVPLRGGTVMDASWDLSASADFNHDGLPDLVWRNLATQKLWIRTTIGTSNAGSGIGPTPDQAANANWIVVAALDYNRDGDTDLLWYNFTSGKLVTWYMDASVVRTSGQFTTPASAGNANWKVVASSDYSGGSGPGTPPLGSPDVVWRNATSGNQVVWHMDFSSTRLFGEFTNPAANAPALDWTIVGPR